MTQPRSGVLEKAVAELFNLPLEEQDRYAAEIPAELANEAKWDRLFASKASQKWLEAAAEEAIAGYKAGRVKEL